MSVHLICEGCGTRLRAKDAAAGKKGRCPKCKRVMTIEEIETLAPESGAAAVERLLVWVLLAVTATFGGLFLFYRP